MSRMLFPGLVVLATVCFGSVARGGAPTARWLGQDGHDLVGPRFLVGPSDVQDIHIVLSDLPRSPLKSVRVAAGGGGEWHTAKPGVWLVHVVRTGIAARADLFMEPSQAENGSRDFEIQLQFESGPVQTVWVKAGRADPGVRMASAKAKAVWGGMSAEDHAGLGPSVGPDGRLDARISLSNLSPKDVVQSIKIDAKGLSAWTFGRNPEATHNAELVHSTRDKTRGDLYFQSDRDLLGKKLDIRITYAGGSVDVATVVAGKTSPNSTVAKGVTFVPAVLTGLKTAWLGQDGVKRHGLGDVHLTLEGLPRTTSIVAAELSDPAGSAWVWKHDPQVNFQGDETPLPLDVSAADATGRRHLVFPPTRNEAGSTLTLRLGFADGRQGVVRFAGGPADPDLRSASPATVEASAKPGDDLHALVKQGGTLRLSAGVYRLTKPLILEQPIKLCGDDGAIVEFSQAKDEAPWTTAIKIHEGHTTLDRLTIRFVGPVRWDRGVGHGPAVIGTSDDRDKRPFSPKFGLVFTNLILDSPPASTDWEDAPNAMRLGDAQCGRIEGNTIRGGSIEFWGGPWKIVNNTYVGTPINTNMPGVFCGHYTKDVLIAGNRAKPVGPCGKSWRFVVLTQRGYRDVVRDNVVENIGARDDDVHLHPNSPEIFLTEAYRIHFEGKPLSVSTDGRVVRLPRLQGSPIASGDVLAVLSGPSAGRWRTVAQPLGGGNYLLDEPLPPGTAGEAVSVVRGFVEDRFEGNKLDNRDSTVCFDLVLGGNHFGLTVKNNSFRGGHEPFRIVASASETPSFWGWTHSPMFGLKIEGNRFEDSWNGGILAVEHSEHTKSSKGRVYWEGLFADNTFVWSDTFVSRRKQGKSPELAACVNVNELPPADPGELVLIERGNRKTGGVSIPSLKVSGASINGRATVGKTLEFGEAASAARGSSQPLR